MLFFKLFHPLTRGSEYEMIYYHQVDFFQLTQIPQDYCDCLSPKKNCPGALMKLWKTS